MSKGSMRLGFSTRRDREPGVGRAFGVFNLVRIDGDRGLNVCVGRLAFDRSDLEPLRERGDRLRVRVVGILRLSSDVSPALASAVLDARVLGVTRADAKTKDALFAGR